MTCRTSPSSSLPHDLRLLGEEELAISCELVFGDSAPIPLSAAETSIAAAREATRRARGASATCATDWRSEAAQELVAASTLLDALDPSALGRVVSSVVTGLRDDILELEAVLRGDR